MNETVLVLGASGRFGRHAAEAFGKAGWTVRKFDRRRDDLKTAAAGVDLIVNGWNPPYDKWEALLPGLTDQVIEAARASGATILQAANIYVYGAGSPPVLGPETPHAAKNSLGRLRIETERKLVASGVRVILLRAGDFIDDKPSGNWFDRIIAAKASKGRLSYPGDPDVPHAWAWLPDLARAAVALAEARERLGPVREVLFPGYTLSGLELVGHVGTALDRDVSLRPMSWLPIHFARPFWPMAKHLLEMSYLWSMPHRIDPADFDALLPDFTETPVDEAIRAALEHQVHPDKAMA